jgi:hypothetical protein
MDNPDTENIAIVGGGISGLFCAFVLLQDRSKTVVLFETSDRLGGRIRTIRLNRANKELTAPSPPPEDQARPDQSKDSKDEIHWNATNLEFYAEFGPMRVELDKQLLLRALLELLHIKDAGTEPLTTNEPVSRNESIFAPAGDAHLTPFPAYASPTSKHDPQYELRPEEQHKTPLQLLQMALMRVVMDLDVEDPKGQGYPLRSFSIAKERLIRDVLLADSTQQPVDKLFAHWMKTLKAEHYWEIQTKGCVRKVPLYSMGFWNLLSDYLSHDAITKVRDLGTFYHLISQNPNAAEWFVWWLLGLGSTEKLQGIFGGMECIVDELLKRCREKDLKHNHTPLIENKGYEVTRLDVTDSGIALIYRKPGSAAPDEEEVYPMKFDRVILALPKCAIQKIAYRNLPAFGKEEHSVAGLLDASFAFPMVKVFIVVKRRWWGKKNMANRYATRVPTREIHYWPGLSKDRRRVHVAIVDRLYKRDSEEWATERGTVNRMYGKIDDGDSEQGLIMLYTDEPASSFWANYINPGAQNDVTKLQELPSDVRTRLLRKLVQYLKESDDTLNENSDSELSEEDIVWLGIRDWGREPYGGANHAWRPERKYWFVMARLGEIEPREKEVKKRNRIHVCGEAYSDYHGFMEGALRSAVYTLHRILDVETGKDDESCLNWLDSVKLKVESEYLESLRKWVRDLDNSRSMKESWVYDGEKNDQVWPRCYFAYGSNMSHSRMRERCPEHQAIGRATLRGYKMIINGDGRANIVKATDELVIGQLYQISEGDDRKLRETATEFKFSRLEAIDVESEHGRKITCFTYKSANNEPGEPSLEYAELLAKGCTIDAMLPGWYSDRYIWPWIEKLVDRKTGKAKTL